MLSIKILHLNLAVVIIPSIRCVGAFYGNFELEALRSIMFVRSTILDRSF